ncbi:MAG: glycosyl hydrolase, partial [Pseudomonadota bacterium]|nr:glycosyl hydrolase [Pseudomonadota bacterium]
MQRKQSSRSRFGSAALLAVLMTSAAPEAIAQVERNIPTEPYAVDEAYLSGLNWRNIGPNRGGRSIAAAGSTARPMEYYFAAVGGGLWKTTDGGTTWNPVTDGQIGTSAVGGVAVCEANPDVVYLTTGETQLRGNILPGDGVYKSVDAGKTWKHIGLREVQNFSRVRVHPTDCNTVFVGGFGHYGAPNPERGVYQSKDGGTTWQKVLYRDPRSGAVDISIDPKNPSVVYAALWEAWRKPWAMSSGGPGSGLFKSIDGGNSWTELTRNPGMPQGVIGKIGVSVSPVDSNRVYAIVEHKEGGVFVSDDAGASWTRTNDSRDLRQRAFYYTRLVADPKIKDRVYVLNVQFFRSDDGGKTFPKKIRVPHGDNHDLWIAADDNQRMIQANDGGANVSVNGGTSWTEQD